MWIINELADILPGVRKRDRCKESGDVTSGHRLNTEQAELDKVHSPVC